MPCATEPAVPAQQVGTGRNRRPQIVIGPDFDPGRAVLGPLQAVAQLVSGSPIGAQFVGENLGGSGCDDQVQDIQSGVFQRKFSKTNRQNHTRGARDQQGQFSTGALGGLGSA